MPSNKFPRTAVAHCIRPQRPALAAALPIFAATLALLVISSSVHAENRPQAPQANAWSAAAMKFASSTTAALYDDDALIRKSTHPIWFDPANDGNGEPVPDVSELLRPDVSDRLDRTADERRGRSWYDYLFGWLNPSSSGGKSAFADFLTLIFQSWRIILVVALLLLVLVAIALLLKFGNFWENGFRRKSKDRALTLEQEAAKIVDLPFEMEQPLLGLLPQAEKYRNEGNYSAATIYLFSYALIEMDASHFIRLERGKTNRTYLRELRDHSELISFTRPLVVAFEYAFFGKHAVDQETFEAIWAQLPSFQAYIAHPTALSKQAGSAPLRPLTPVEDFA